MPSVFDLTDRQWTQVRAALAFWREVAEHSKQHPSRHPGVEEMFRQYGPMSLDEIDELLEGTPAHLLVSARQLANLYGIKRNKKWLDNLLRKHGIESETNCGRVRLFRVDKLGPLLDEFERRGITPKQKL